MNKYKMSKYKYEQIKLNINMNKYKTSKYKYEQIKLTIYLLIIHIS